MASEDVANILQGLIAGQHRRLSYAQLASVDRDRSEREAARKEQLDIEHKRLDETQRQFDLSYKAAQAVHTMSIAQQKQKMAENAMNGLPIVGEGTVVRQPMDGGGFQETHTLPQEFDQNGKPQSFTVPDKETMARQAAQHWMTQNQPIEEMKSRLQAQKEEADLAKAAAKSDDDYKKATKLAELTSDRQLAGIALHNKGLMEVAHTKGYYMIQAAKNKGDADAIDTEPLIEGIRNLTLNKETINMMPGKQKGQVVRDATALGLTIPDKKDQDLPKAFDAGMHALQRGNDFIEFVKQNPVSSRIPMSPQYNQAQQMLKELTENGVSALTVLGQGGRLSKDRIDRLQEAYTTSLSPTAGLANAAKVKNLSTLLNDALDSSISHLSPSQQVVLKSKITGVNPRGSQQGSPGISPAVAKALSNQPPGVHKLSDGTTWMKNPDGSIKQVTQ